ncbi:Lipopolysaccharide biosynthesis protein WzxC [subsurface metagenome]
MVNKIKKVFNNLITPGGTLSQKAIKGGFWVFFLRITNRGFSLIRLIILARILAPSDFGLMGIALLTMSTLETFSQTGFQQALIQKKEDIESYLNSAWTVLILRGFILFIILYFIAPYAAIFFNSPEAKPIIRVIGFSILFQAFTNIGIIYFKKELEFNKEFIYQFSGTLADIVVAVSAVLILRNVWAIVFGLLAGNMIRCFVSYFIHPYRPHFSKDLGMAKKLFGFGKWIMGSSILIFLTTQGDDIFVGKFLGATALGFYQLAYRISNMPATEITHVISQVTFPAYSKLQDDIPKLREAYLKVLQLTAFLSFPIAGLIFILAPDFTRIFLGEKWMSMVPAMQVLTVYGMLRSIGATNGPVFQAIGRPDISTKLQFLNVLMLAIFIYPLTMEWDILGTSIAVSLCSVLKAPISFYIATKVVRCSFREFLKKIWIPFLNISMTIGCIYFVQLTFPEQSGIPWFSLLCVIGIILYIGFSLIADKYFGCDLVRQTVAFLHPRIHPGETRA